MTLGNFISAIVVFLIGWAVGEFSAEMTRKEPPLETDEICDVAHRIAEYCNGDVMQQQVMIDELYRYLECQTEAKALSKPLFDIINSVTNYGE